jgi:hypothetical protein
MRPVASCRLFRLSADSVLLGPGDKYADSSTSPFLKDTGTLQYDMYFNDDQSECIVLERFRDSEALIEHAAHLGDLTEVILATGSVSGELLGEPNAELRAKLAGSEVPVLFTPYQSM